MINIAICDDDLEISNKMVELIEDLAKKRLIYVQIELFSDGNYLLKHLKSNPIDMIFLDIEMKFVNGIQTAKLLREKGNDAVIIYVSSHDNYMIELFEVEPFRFIKKPIKEKDFETVFYQAIKKVKSINSFFEYKANKYVYKVKFNDILYFESHGRIVLIHTKDEEYSFYDKLNNIENCLKNQKTNFLRIHQSYLINVDKVRKYCVSSVEMINNIILPISDDKQKIIKQQFLNLVVQDYAN